MRRGSEGGQPHVLRGVQTSAMTGSDASEHESSPLSMHTSKDPSSNGSLRMSPVHPVIAESVSGRSEVLDISTYKSSSA